METRLKKKSQIIDIGITAAALVLSLGTMLYGISRTLSVILLLMDGEEVYKP